MLKILASAKINLCLDILDKDASSDYHHIQSIILETPNIHNEITLTEAATSSENPVVALLKRHFDINKHVQIEIKQGIAHSSGLGGYSSNCASILKALNELWGLSLSDKDMSSLAAKMGMDVPFFLKGGVAFATNFGEKITQLPPLDLKFNIDQKSSPLRDKTAQAYDNLDLSLCGHNTVKTEQALRAIRNSDMELLMASLHNDFETVTKVEEGQHLSGAGPSIFSF